MLPILVMGLGLALACGGVLLLWAALEVAFAEPVPGAPRVGWRAFGVPPVFGGHPLWQWAANRARALLVGRLGRRYAAGSSRELIGEVIEGAAKAADASPQGAPAAGDDGCVTRKFVRLGLTAPEALQIADFLKENCPPSQVQAIDERAAANAVRTASLAADQHWQARVTCPLLTAEQTCAVWPVRPLACRGWRPLDETATCQGTGECAASTTLRHNVPLDSYAFEVCEGAEHGMARAMSDAGLDGRVYELNAALHVALTDDQAGQRWLEGATAFPGGQKCG